MFEIGFAELVLLFVVALIVVGPERLPALARTLGQWVAKARRMVAEVKGEIEREVQVEELKQAMRQQEGIAEIKHLAERVKSINSEVQGVITDVTTPTPTLPPRAPTVPSGAAASPEPPVK
jgi:sec-independent protein translocase protein TatB